VYKRQEEEEALLTINTHLASVQGEELLKSNTR
jgi:hypothetical protein